MDNQRFLLVILNSFKDFLDSGTSRSTAKLKPLHGAIARDLAARLPGYTIMAQGFKDGKEGTILGRYMPKKVDIVILKDNKVVAGVAVKFVMQNYSQNSNNYFENMLGETANIRSKGIPYFQIFIILDKLPYYEKNAEKTIKKWEELTEHHLEKYVTLSKDPIQDDRTFLHSPDRTLLFVVHLPENRNLNTWKEYKEFYYSKKLTVSSKSFPKFGPLVILNDWEKFSAKVYHTIKLNEQ